MTAEPASAQRRRIPRENLAAGYVHFVCTVVATFLLVPAAGVVFNMSSGTGHSVSFLPMALVFSVPLGLVSGLLVLLLWQKLDEYVPFVRIILLSAVTSLAALVIMGFIGVAVDSSPMSGLVLAVLYGIPLSLSALGGAVLAHFCAPHRVLVRVVSVFAALAAIASIAAYLFG